MLLDILNDIKNLLDKYWGKSIDGSSKRRSLMAVKDFMTRKVVYISPDTTVSHAADFDERARVAPLACYRK